MLKLIIVCVLSSFRFDVVVGLEDPMLESMWGPRGANRVTVCLAPRQQGRRQCSGALAHARLVLVRASCLLDQTPHSVHMLPTTEDFSCDDAAVSPSDKMRRVARWYVHPNYHESPCRNDYALIDIKRPYDMDYIKPQIKLSNNTYSMLEKFNPWIHKMIELHQPAYTMQHRQTSPEKLFLMAVLLPFISFILFFIYVTSGTSLKDHQGQQLH